MNIEFFLDSFFCQYFKVSYHYNLAFITCEKKSALSLTVKSWYVISHFSFDTCEIFLLSLSFISLTIKCLGVDCFDLFY